MAGVLLAGFVIAISYFHFTSYAPGFSPEAFSKIKEGMTSTEVKKLIGEPLSTFHGNSYTILNKKGEVTRQGSIITKDYYSKSKFVLLNFYYVCVSYDSSGRVTHCTVRDEEGDIYRECGDSHNNYVDPKFWRLKGK